MKSDLARPLLRASPMTTSERVGEWLGRTTGPLFAAVSRRREARTFHPRGDLVKVRFDVSPSVSPLHGALARRLSGAGLMRLSNALWKRPHAPDALGCAVCWVDAQGSAEQHLLLATIQRPWTTLLAPATTHVHDFLANDYFAVSPFDVGLKRLVYLSLRRRVNAALEHGDDRRSVLERHLAADDGFTLCLSEGPRGPWQSLVEVHLESLLPPEPENLRFDPFLDGRGLSPRGFVHALRRGAYAASRAGRSDASGAGTVSASLRVLGAE